MTNENPDSNTERHESADETDNPGTAAVDEAFASTPDESVESLRLKLAEAEKQALLCQADLENFRRRKSREAQEQVKYASLPLISSLLDVADNLHRALDSAAEDNATSLREGVQIVAGQFKSTLEQHGCREIEALGKVFDPNEHEAIQMQPADEPLNTIVMEVQTGYKLHDRVVRPTRVIVSTGPSTGQE